MIWKTCTLVGSGVVLGGQVYGLDHFRGDVSHDDWHWLHEWRKVQLARR
ncbi:hypothetical protein NX722_24750 [Endozoicomonas gorgoniicola]|uniref:Uncharacterized protein n=1 Tax=Endozoicomonas gorgoniicola TaxID=1234144 RepID=A0ABT3N2C7_9GAMM|nr:hypothetical protein [Endozoicomonas gorgoniicola]MCW7555776.1 hypothetical protein [Endozoicomonas gorgoniicola]